MKIALHIFTVSMLLLVANSSQSHHSFPAHYDGDKEVIVTGEVKEFKYENPHARIYLLVTTDDETVEWLVEMGSRNGMYRAGWRQEHIATGDIIRVTGSPSRKVQHAMHASAITTADGGSIGPGSLSGRTTAR
jgi:DNA/RNA endonuclease YhcR with UshA esterase domain